MSALSISFKRSEWPKSGPKGRDVFVDGEHVATFDWSKADRCFYLRSARGISRFPRIGGHGSWDTVAFKASANEAEMRSVFLAAWAYPIDLPTFAAVRAEREEEARAEAQRIADAIITRRIEAAAKPVLAALRALHVLHTSDGIDLDDPRWVDAIDAATRAIALADGAQ